MSKTPVTRQLTHAGNQWNAQQMVLGRDCAGAKRIEPEPDGIVRITIRRDEWVGVSVTSRKGDFISVEEFFAVDFGTHWELVARGEKTLTSSSALNHRNRRLGRFRINEELLHLHCDELLAIFSACVVVEARHRYEYRCIEYLAYSELFEVCPEGSVPPVYEVVFKRVSDVIGLLEVRIDAGALP